MRYSAFLATVLVICVSATVHAQAKPAAKVTYEQDILPILRDNCFACHSQDKQKGGLRVDNFTSLMQGGSSGEVVKPGAPDDSRLFQTVAHDVQPFMPPKSPPIAKESIEKIRRWIAGGALENAGSKAVVVNRPKYDISLSAAAKGKPEGPPPLPEKRLSLDPVVRSSRPGAITALAASPWAPLVAVSGQKQVLLYHSDTFDLLGVLPFPEGAPHVLKFSRNGSLLLAGGGRGGKSGRVVVWSVKTGERIFEVGDELDCVLAADISPDQTQIALGGPAKMIRVYSTQDGKLQHEIKKHTDWLYSLEFSPDGVLLATGDRNGGLFVWEAHTGREFFSLRGHTMAINDLSWRADSNVLASASEDGSVRLWEMENGGQIKTWGHGAPVQSVKFYRDGRLLTCGRDRLVKLWDGNGGLQRAFEALPDMAMRVAMSHDGGRVIGGDWSGTVRVWAAADGKAVASLSANPLPVAEQLAEANKDLAVKEAAYKQLAAVAATAQAAEQQAAADLAAAQKAVAEGPARIKAAQDAAALAKQEVEKANAALAQGQMQVSARDIVAKAYTEAAAKIKAEAGKAAGNGELVAAAARSQALAAQAVTDLDAARKAMAGVATVVKAASDKLTASQQNVASVTAVVAAGPKNLEARTAQAKAAQAQAAASKAAADRASADLAGARARVERLKAALPVAQQAAK
jgi:hypothetical protein